MCFIMIQELFQYSMALRKNNHLNLCIYFSFTVQINVYFIFNAGKN
jgi:hypothetical protein